MSVICPRCHGEKTSVFSDSVYKTHGYFCEDCKKDFGVDDGKTFKNYEEKMTEFYYRHTFKDQSTKEITFKKSEKGIQLSASITKDKILSVSDPVAIDDGLYNSLALFAFEKAFLLDWENSMTAFITKDSEFYTIEVKFSDPELKPIKKEGYKMPVYLMAFDNLFDSIFESLKYNDQEKH